MSGPRFRGNKSQRPKRHTHAFNAESGAGRIKEMASPVLQKQRVPGGSMWADGTPEDPLGAGQRRGEGDGGRGFPGSAHLAAAFSALGRARPPPARSRAGGAPARRGPAPCTSRQQPETHLPSQPRHRSLSVKQAELCRVEGPGRLRPASSPRLTNREMATPPRGRGHVGGARRVEPGGLGAGPGGAGALTTLLRAGSGPVLGAAGQRWDRGAGATMPVTGKAFRRRRADSESEEDEQDSEEVRCVWNGLSAGQKARSWLGVSPPARSLVDTLATGSRWWCPLLRTKKWRVLGLRPHS